MKAAAQEFANLSISEILAALEALDEKRGTTEADRQRYTALSDALVRLDPEMGQPF